MTIVTVMLCVILGLVYYFTKENIETTNIAMMQNIANHPFQLAMPNGSSDDIHIPYFALQIDIQGNLLAIGGGYFDLSDKAFLMDLMEQTFSKPEEIGIIDEYHLRFCRVATLTSQIIVYSDISSELAVLNNLMKSCAAIGIIAFAVFFGLSLLLARWAVKPIDKAWQQQRQFIADASHELKTPLTVIITNAELMQNPDYTESNRSKFILVMARQMRGLVEQMLELARTDNDAQTNTMYSKIDFSELVSDAILPFEPVFFEKGLSLQSSIAPDIWLGGNPSQLREVIDILLDNAQKYSRAGGCTWITLAKQRKNHCLLSVANEGDEIPPEDLKNLFKRFYRADRARSRSGSFGLGLSIAENIITRHKGKIWVESRNNVNTFFVELHCTAFSNNP